MREHKHARLFQAYLHWNDRMQEKKRHTLRLKAIERGASNMDAEFERRVLEGQFAIVTDDGTVRYLSLDMMEERAKEQMVAEGEAVGPIWDWLVGIKGIGPHTAAKLLALFDDVGRFATVSKFWRFAGWAVMDGEIDRCRKGEKSPYNRRLKSECFLVAESFVKQQTPLYSSIYYEEKERQRSLHPHPICSECGAIAKQQGQKWVCSECKASGRAVDFTPLHLDFRAKRKMVKIFLCYSDDTKVWGRQGPVPLSKVVEGDEIATLNSHTGCVEYQPITATMEYEYSGDLIHFLGESYDFLVTPNHRMWVKKRGHDWRFYDARHFSDGTSPERERAVEAVALVESLVGDGLPFAKVARDLGIPETTLRRWIYKDQYPRGTTSETWEFKIDAGWEGVDNAEISDEWLEFFGWWIAEGHTYKSPDYPGGYTVGVTNNDPKVRTRIVELLEGMGYHTYVNYNQVCVSSKELYGKLAVFGKAHQKFVPETLKHLPPHRLRILLDSMLAGDGSWTERGNPKLYTTVSKRLQIDVAELALKCGYGIRLSTKSKDRIEGANYDQHIVHFRVSHVTPWVRRPKRVPYKGIVRCVIVPNHIILAGRCGKFAWCGNSHLWVKWREFEGLPVSRPYVQDILGHIHIVEPE